MHYVNYCLERKDDPIPVPDPFSAIKKRPKKNLHKDTIHLEHLNDVHIKKSLDEAVTHARNPAHVESQALDEAAEGLERSQSKDPMLPVTGLDYKALTMEQVIDRCLLEFCKFYRLLLNRGISRHKIISQLDKNLRKQIEIMKAKNDHDNQGEILKIIMKLTIIL